MGRLDRISMEELHELLAEVDEGTPTQRVLAAIAYKQGDSKTRLAERHDVTWKTVHSWLNRFASSTIHWYF
ncbi:MAG: helix-turn-helix domain-containing protein [Halobacteriales archaeon]